MKWEITGADNPAVLYVSGGNTYSKHRWEVNCIIIIFACEVRLMERNKKKFSNNIIYIIRYRIFGKTLDIAVVCDRF